MITGTIADRQDEPYVTFDRDEFLTFLSDLRQTNVDRWPAVQLPDEVRW